MPVLPEQLGLLFVARGEDVHAGVRPRDGQHRVHGVGKRGLVVGVQLQDEHADGVALVLAGLLAVLDGLHVLGAELLQGRNLDPVALGADGVAQADDVADDEHGVLHAAAIELQAQHAGVFGFGVQGEHAFGDDAVHALLLHARQAAQVLVRNVLAQAQPAHVGSGQDHGVLQAASLVQDLKRGGLALENLVAGVVVAAHGDDLALGRDHGEGGDVVDGGAVLEGERPAGVLGDVSAQRRGRLGGRVHGEQKALLVCGLDGVQRDDAGLGGEQHALRVHVNDLLEPRQRQDHRAREHGNGPAGESGAAAARDHAKGQLTRQADNLLHLIGCLREKHEQRQLQAQVGGVGGALDTRVGLLADELARQKLQKTGLKVQGETLVRVVALPEAGHGPGQHARVLAGQTGPGDGQLAVHALAHQLCVHKGIVAHQEQLCGQADGQLAHAVRPLGEAALFGHGLQAQHAGQDAFIGNGDMRTDQRHWASTPGGMGSFQGFGTDARREL